MGGGLRAADFQKILKNLSTFLLSIILQLRRIEFIICDVEAEKPNP